MGQLKSIYRETEAQPRLSTAKSEVGTIMAVLVIVAGGIVMLDADRRHGHRRLRDVGVWAILTAGEEE
jgi:hypothetical protein